eukprot:scaffold1032_cov54-Phaeocystis_antarctica.AAC.2
MLPQCAPGACAGLQALPACPGPTMSGSTTTVSSSAISASAASSVSFTRSGPELASSHACGGVVSLAALEGGPGGSEVSRGKDVSLAALEGGPGGSEVSRDFDEASEPSEFLDLACTFCTNKEHVRARMGRAARAKFVKRRRGSGKRPSLERLPCVTATAGGGTATAGGGGAGGDSVCRLVRGNGGRRGFSSGPGGGAAGCDSVCRLVRGNGGRRGFSSGWHGEGGGWQCTRSVCPCATSGGKFTMRHCPGRASGGSAKRSASPPDLSRMICPTRNMPSVTASFIQRGAAGSA